MKDVLRRFRRHARVTASAALAVMGVMLFVTCVSAADMTPEQKACCAAMHHDCGKTAVQASCCEGEIRQDRSLAATKPTIGLVPLVALVAILTTPPLPIAYGQQAPLVDRSSSGPPGVPTYLFVSSFRI